MLRSLLNVPGNRPDMLAKASSYGADALIIDLEDAVPAAQKVETRVIAAEFVDTFARRGSPVLVRVNGPDTGLMEDDLAAVVQVALTGVQMPKVHSADDVRRVDTALARLEDAAQIPTGQVELLISLESAAAIHFAYDILSAAPRVGCVMVAAAEHGDLHGDLGFVSSKTEEELWYVRSAVLVAARAAGVPYPIDGVYADVRDIEGFTASCRRARQIGYRGKKVIHPRQVEIANEVFSATPQELEHYERILEAMDIAEREGRAVAVVDGRMVDIAMAETARRARDRIHSPGEDRT
jgi:citrate lyase subunit beta/citryl-CoA lyase